MAADPVIKKALADVKFKWKSLVNDPSTGKRAQIMELKKPTGDAASELPAFENTRNLQIGKEPITIKSGIIFELGTKREEGKETDKQNSSATETIFAPVSVLSCLRKFQLEAQDGSVLSEMNSKFTDPLIKQYLKVANNIVAPKQEGEEDINFIATKDCLEFD